ncbi:MAG: YhjD/YihY/BrkB family envelope integrity protein [Kiritimatiellae bacterium]|nr:YhjD/YihY/BrkB family envelope integrity protein [Kiritimatiellia bacterium]
MAIDLKKKWQMAVQFLFHDLWTVEATRSSGPFRMGVRLLRVCALVIRGFRDDDLPMHASALAFTSVLSLIPMLAIIFSVLQGLGVGETRMGDVQEWVNEMPVQFQEFVERILEVARKTNFAALGVVGLITLLIFAAGVLSNIETSFNRIWGISQFRNPIRRVINYISIIAVVPVLIAFSGTVSAFLNSPTMMDRFGAVGFLYTFLLKFLPYFLMWMALFLLYTALPNTRVHQKPALVASLFGAILLLAWQAVYLDFQVGVASRNAIYGTFASIPIFLAWMYISWVIVLLGAKLAFAFQNESTIHIEQYSEGASLESRVSIALAVLGRCGDALQGDQPPFDTAEFAEQRKVPVRLLNEVCGQLVDTGWLTERAEQSGSYALLRAPERIKIKDIFYTILRHGSSPKQLGIDHLSASVERTLQQFDQGMAEALKEETLETMLVKQSG